MHVDRVLLLQTCIAGILATVVAVGVGSHPTEGTGGIVIDYQNELRTQIIDGADERERLERFHQLRNAQAMVDLVSALPPTSRPRHILYLASGSHLAPLALCELLPAGAPCSLVLTEIDGSIGKDVSALLHELSRTERISALQLDNDGRFWQFQLAGHPVRIELELVGRGSLVEPALVHDADLVINHDWSGDPLGILMVVDELLLALRSLDGAPPMLMIEDLERHPYPIDLSFFSPVVRTRQSYGHRTSERGTGHHGDIELGEPLFGGGVLLDLSDLWWRTVDRKTLDGVFNLLLFNEFDTERQNVLVGGEDPLLAPAMLDWYSNFGSRTIAGGDLNASPGSRSEIMIAAAAAMPSMEPDLRRRLACRLQLYNCVLQARATDAEIRESMPSARYSRRAGPGDFPTETMDSMYREALRHAGDYRRRKEAEHTAAQHTVEALSGTSVLDAMASCPIPQPAPDEDPAAFWLAAYQRLAEDLSVD